MRIDARRFKDAMWEQGDTPLMQPCFCVGPQNGAPLCPCRMRGVTVVNGRYVEITDHGPVTPAETTGED